MVFSTAFVDGLVLTATVQDDRHGASALGGLAPGLARATRARLAELAAMSRPERHRVVRALVGALTALPSNAALPSRAGALLAPREDGREGWTTPRVRRGFRASRGLRVTLRRLASSSSEHAKEPRAVRLDRASRELALVAEAPWR